MRLSGKGDLRSKLNSRDPLTRRGGFCYHTHRSGDRTTFESPRGPTDCGWRVPYKVAFLMTNWSNRNCHRDHSRSGASERRSRIELEQKTGNFLKEKRNTGTRHVQSTWRILFRVFPWALSGASVKTLMAGCATPMSARVGCAGPLRRKKGSK